MFVELFCLNIKKHECQEKVSLQMRLSFLFITKRFVFMIFCHSCLPPPHPLVIGRPFSSEPGRQMLSWLIPPETPNEKGISIFVFCDQWVMWAVILWVVETTAIVLNWCIGLSRKWDAILSVKMSYLNELLERLSTWKRSHSIEPLWGW